MMFDQIVGNGQAKAYLSKALTNHRFPHAILFSGPSGIGKSLFAQEVAACLLQTTKHKIEAELHPDFHPLKPESKSGLHSIDSLRALINEVHSAPFESFGKVFVIYDAERMQTASANALLKTLEEPNPDTTIILLTEHPDEVIPTIRSRCGFLSFKSIPEEEIASFLKGRGLDDKWAKIAQGSIGKAFNLATKPILETALFSLLAERPLYPQLLIAIEKIEESIEDDDPVKKNQNAEHILTAFLMWHRDQTARRLGVSEKDLLMSDVEPVGFPLPKIEHVIKWVEEARLNLQRNIKFSTCLESLFSIR